jgi:hypothetical protein
MDRNLKVWAGIALIAGLSACKGDPTTGLVGGVSTLTTSVSYLTVNVGDSVLVTATVRDAADEAVAAPATATSNATTVVAVSSGPAAPEPQTSFFVRGVAYGTGSVTFTSGAATATVNVRTYPAFVAIVGSRDSLLSGATRQLSFQPEDQSLAAIAVSDTFAWSTNPSQVVASVLFSVVPAPFSGTLSATTANPLQTITITKAGADPAFDADVAATFGGTPAFIQTNNGTTLSVVMPVTGKAGSVPLLITNIGSGQLARSAAFTSGSASIADPDSPNGDAIGSEVVLTAKGDYFGVLRGSCVQGGDIEGGAESPGDKCDKYYKVTNAGATPDTVVVQLDWLDGAASSSDIDLIGCNTACSGSFNFQGATSANPEKASIVIPAGATRLIVVEEFDNKTLPSMLFRLRITKGLP